MSTITCDFFSTFVKTAYTAYSVFAGSPQATGAAAHAAVATQTGSSAIQNLSAGTVIELAILAYVCLMLIVTAATFANKWRWNVWLTTFLVSSVLVPAMIYGVYSKGHIEGLAIIVFGLFVGLIIWQDVMFKEHQQKFEEHDKKVVAVFEQSNELNELNAEARRLHSITVAGLKGVQLSLVGRLDHDGGFCVDAYRSKFGQICSQIGMQDIYVRGVEFGGLWKKLVDLSKDYASICDLSMYSKITPRVGDKKSRDIYEGDKAFWTGRLGDEIDELIRTGKSPNTFQKIIVYAALEGYEEPDSRPKCVSEGYCDYEHCKKECIVKVVAQKWKDSERRFVGNIHSLVRLLPGHGPRPFIWLVRKDQIEIKLAAINNIDGKDRTLLDSADIGVFGNHFVGEEFKVQAATGATRVYDFLYRIRSDELLAKRIYAAFDDLNEDGLIRVA
jgi:hypothetical protein